MKKKSLRILSIVAVMVLALTVATTAFAASVSTTTKYIVGADNVNQIKVDTAISDATPASHVSYLVTAGTNAEPSSSNVLYMNQYEVDGSGSASISYKLDTTADNFPANFKTTVRFGSTAGDQLSDSLAALETYRVFYNSDGSINVLPVEGYELGTIKINNSNVGPYALTYAADEDDLVEVTTTALSNSSIGDDKIAAATKNIDSTNMTVNYLLQPCANSGIKEIGVKYGNLLFPSLAKVDDEDFIGVTNVLLDFSEADNVDGVQYVFADEAAKIVPYYVDANDVLHYYEGSEFTAED